MLLRSSLFRSSVRLASTLKLLLLALIFVTLGFAVQQPARAALRDGLVFRVGCDGFISRGGDIVLNRDNTGTGREQFVITATDGNGNTIYNPTTESFLVGARITLPPGLFFAWTQAPSANPLTVRMYSPAGNGLNEQTIYLVTGSCGDLETVESTIALDILEILDGRTSPSVEINTVPPRGTNPEDASLNRPGYVIVNTDNLNIRSGDGPEYTIVGRVDGGTELIVLGRNVNRTWWYVQVGDLIGWVSSELILIRGDLTSIPVVPVVGEIARPTLFVFSTQTLLALPIEGALAVCEITGNLEYYVIGRNAASTWFELEAVCNGANVTGWIKAEMGGLRNQAESFIPVTD